MAKKPATIPSVLSFEKKLVPSDAQMFACDWADRSPSGWQPLQVREKALRGTISNRLDKTTEKDPAKLNAKVESPNLQTVDHCALPADKDTLVVKFSLKVLSGVEQPSACNLEAFAQTYRDAVRSYIDTEGFTEIARRYATNIANARFLWRNRVGAENIEVRVQQVGGDLDQTFDAKGIGLGDFEDRNVDAIAGVIAESLSGQREFSLFEITATAQLGGGQEVYPSEELVTEKGDKGRVLYSVDNVAAMHSQKLGNAIRTIDTWYQDDAPRPIAVEVYGSVTNLGIAYRKPTAKNDFYSLFDAFGQGLEIDEDQRHYVMAMLVRGGVFGLSAK